jgi:hypothetical protein
LNFINTGSGQRKNATTEAVNTNLPPEQVPDELKDLYARKLKAEVRRAEAQANKLELEFAEKKGLIIPTSTIQLYIGHFVFGINNFFFNVAPRVARDDKILRERIQKEISIAIKKTKQHAAEESRKGVVAVYKEDMKHGLN